MAKANTSSFLSSLQIKNPKILLFKLLIIFVPTFTISLMFDKMVFVLPTLAIGLLASGGFDAPSKEENSKDDFEEGND